MFDTERMKKGITEFLSGIYGDGFEKEENFKETPDRIVKAFCEILSGEEVSALSLQDTILNKRFPTDYEDIICTSWIESNSMCPHHFLPVHYKTAVAYLPRPAHEYGWVIGASKIERLVQVLSARAVLQETLTYDIGNTIEETLHTKGVAVIVIGSHGCMKCRGIKTNADYKTSRMTGSFLNSEKTRAEFFQLISL